MMKHPKQFLKNDSGASLVEYGMLTGLIAVASIAAVVVTGDKITESFTHSGDQIYVWRQIAAGNDPSAECYNPANNLAVGTGRWPACDGMVIVNDATIASASSTANGGDGSYQIVGSDGEVYTFQDSERNIFTGQVTDMSSIFQGDSSWNGDIGYWDTSNVTDMSRMFFGASSFNQHIGSWNTASVETFEQTFRDTTDFNSDLSAWDTGQATIMSGMFSGASKFNRPVGSWDTSNVVNMMGMFTSATAFNQDIGNWETDNVTEMMQMFFLASNFDQDLSGWCVPHMDPSDDGISSGRFQFDYSASSWDDPAHRPQWGTCPST